MGAPLKLPVSMRTATKGASPELRDAQEGSSDDPLGKSLHPVGKNSSTRATGLSSAPAGAAVRPGVLPPFNATAVPVREQGDTQPRPRRRLRRTAAGAEMPPFEAPSGQKYPPSLAPPVQKCPSFRARGGIYAAAFAPPVWALPLDGASGNRRNAARRL